jgi:hypothetical protein
LPVIQTALFCHVSCGKLGNPHFKKPGWSFNRGKSVDTRLSLVVPAYSEGGPLGYGLERRMEWLCPDDTEIIVVDDWSTHDTGQIATGLLARWSHLSLIALTKNRSTGAAVKSGGIRREKTPSHFWTPT